MLMKEKYALTFLCLYLECPSLASTGCSGSAPPPPATRLPYRALPARRLALPPLPELWLYVCSSSYHLVFWFVLSDSCTRMPSPWGQGQALTLLAHTETPVQHPVYCTEDPSVSAKGMVRITEGWCLYWGLFLFRFKIQSLNLLWLGLRYLWPPQLPAEASFLGWVWMYTPAQGGERAIRDPGNWDPPSSPPSDPPHGWPSFWKTELFSSETPVCGTIPRRVEEYLEAMGGRLSFLSLMGQEWMQVCLLSKWIPTVLRTCIDGHLMFF